MHGQAVWIEPKSLRRRFLLFFSLINIIALHFFGKRIKAGQTTIGSGQHWVDCK